MSKKVCVIGVYFGKFPKMFPIWLESCRANKNIDFYVFSNNDSPDSFPSNVFFIRYTLSKIQKKASEILSFPAVLDRPYKCCDYKPMYGLLFQEYIRDYLFWGHCDFDMVFGDIESFFFRYNLWKYDKINGLGHLSFYRNCEKVNYAFMIESEEKTYKNVYTKNENLVFDELDGITKIMLSSHYRVFLKRIFLDISALFYRFKIIETYPYDLPPINYRNQVFYYDKGKVWHAYCNKDVLYREEYMYIHFKGRTKMRVDKEISSSFFITNKGFFYKDKDVSLEDMKKYNPFYGLVLEWIEGKIKKGLWMFKSRTKFMYEKQHA